MDKKKEKERDDGGETDQVRTRRSTNQPAEDVTLCLLDSGEGQGERHDRSPQRETRGARLGFERTASELSRLLWDKDGLREFSYKLTYMRKQRQFIVLLYIFCCSVPILFGITLFRI